MNYFRYKLIEPTGVVSSGIVKLPFHDVISVISHLERDGNMVIQVKAIGPVISSLLKLGTMGIGKGLSRVEQAELLSNMALMARSGVPLTTALEESAQSAEKPNIATDLSDLVRSIQGGLILSEAASKYPKIFPGTILHLLKIGEETGRMDEMLKEGADHLKRMQTILSDTKQALLYPSFVLIAMTGGLLFWFYYVVPKIMTLFKEMDVSLPPLTLFILGVSDFLQVYFFQLILGVAMVFILIPTAYKSSPKFKAGIDSLLLKLPISKTIISASSLAFITEYLSLLMRAGIDILRSIAILRNSVKNEVYRKRLDLVEENLKKGQSIADSFKDAIIFPQFVCRMIGIGEVSGTLTEQLVHIADEYKNKLSILVSTMGKMIEPIVLIVAGLMFAIIIGGLLLPIYDLIGKIQ